MDEEVAVEGELGVAAQEGHAWVLYYLELFEGFFLGLELVEGFGGWAEGGAGLLLVWD